MTPLRTVVIGLGQMGKSHALAYHRNPGFRSSGWSIAARRFARGACLLSPPSRFETALALKPDLASINTYTDSHAELAIRAMTAGANVFIEKPLAANVEDARRVVETATRTGRKLVIGYILRHHPSWMEFIRLAREMGPPFVMRMNLNQQSSGAAWDIHKRLMLSTSPVVDCGVHYIDVMCQITDARPVQVRGMGVRLSEEIDPSQVNFGHLQVLFDDGSIGWYEAGWGPMMSETAFFVKDVMSPRGSVSIIMAEGAKSADVDTHTKTSTIRVHHAARDEQGAFKRPDDFISMADEPGHQDLCEREQDFVLRAITEGFDLSRHMQDAVTSLEVVLAADRSMRERRAIDL